MDPQIPLPHPIPCISLPPSQTNIHPMTTKNKLGILKPKLYTATLVYKELDFMYEAMQHPEWLTATREEYAALVKNDKWSLVLSVNLYGFITH